MINKIRDIKRYDIATLKNDLKFDIYYTDSLEYAMLSPHLAHKLEDHIFLNDSFIKSGSLLYYEDFKTDDLRIFEPDHQPSLYKVTKERYEEDLRKLKDRL